MTWEERVFERSAAVRRSRKRVADQSRAMLDAANRLIAAKGDAFTTQELAAEAGVALQTFYRYFPSKDELLLAVIADAMTAACQQWEEAAQSLPTAIERLRFFVTTSLDRLIGSDQDVALNKFIVGAHWRLHRLFPKELAQAEQPFVDLLRSTVEAAVTEGSLRSVNSTWDPWFIVELVRSVYHYYAFAEHDDDEINTVKERLWHFCGTALTGSET